MFLGHIRRLAEVSLEAVENVLSLFPLFAGRGQSENSFAILNGSYPAS